MENKNMRVVVVDDSVITTGQLVPFFKTKMGFDVVAIGKDGNEALSLYRTHLPDLITLDVTMPNKDGYNATLEILHEFPNANILIISALQGDSILKCIAAGAKGYVTKPVSLANQERIKDLENTVKGILKIA